MLTGKITRTRILLCNSQMTNLKHLIKIRTHTHFFFMWKKKHITTFKHQKRTADIYPPGASYSSAVKLNQKYFIQSCRCSSENISIRFLKHAYFRVKRKKQSLTKKV